MCKKKELTGTLNLQTINQRIAKGTWDNVEGCILDGIQLELYNRCRGMHYLRADNQLVIQEQNLSVGALCSPHHTKITVVGSTHIQ